MEGACILLGEFKTEAGYSFRNIIIIMIVSQAHFTHFRKPLVFETNGCKFNLVQDIARDSNSPDLRKSP